MKLFTKTLLFFISIIIFQSSLTIFLITNITKRNNLEDAVEELKNEATIVFDNYNSWKRGIWKDLIEIQADLQISEILQNHREASFQKNLTGYLKEMLQGVGIDIFVVRNSTHSETDIISITYNNFSLFELQSLENRKLHPYIDLRLLGNQLCVIGIIRLELDAPTYLDFFLIKRIDRDFCNQLILNRSSHASFFLAQKPAEMGALAVEWGYKFFKEKAQVPKKVIPGFEFFTRENVNDPGMQQFIYQ